MWGRTGGGFCTATSRRRTDAVDVNVNDCVVAVFTVTLPKLNVAALTVNCGLGAAVLVPLKVTCAVAPVDELLLIAI